MKLISPEAAARFYNAIQILHDDLPLAESVADLVAPEYAPEIAAGRIFLAKLFELVSASESHDSPADVATALHELRTQTETDWRDLLAAKTAKP